MIESPPRAWLPRIWILVVVLLVGAAVGRLVVSGRSGDSAVVGQVVVVALTVLFTVPMAVFAWRSTSAPYPHDRTMLVESRRLDGATRKAVGRALRRGRAIDPAHRVYAVARTAQDRRAMIVVSLTPALAWSQVANVATDRFGSRVFWAMAVAAVVLSVSTLGLVLVQLRCERTLRATVPGLDPH